MGDETVSWEASTAGVPSQPPATTRIAIGARVGRYQVRRLLGEGGMGSVYLARDMTLGRSVALKLVRGQRSDSAQLLVEAQMTARFSHPHIVQLYDVGEHGGRTYLALEYLEGDSLRERMREDPPSPDEVYRIARAVADALAHAHAGGVLHRDLKPSNIMLPRDGRVRVVDFGLATSLDVAAAPAGTADWMAPEQWRGEVLSDRADIWALGVIVYSVLAGAHPHGIQEDVVARRAATLAGDTAPPLPTRIPDTICELVQRSLAHDPAARPSAADWVRVLDEIIEGRPTSNAHAAPYRGLAAFDEAEAYLFHGRDADVDAFLEQLRATPLVAIVGPSGAGKSSFLRAGVVHRLRARDRWTVISLRPGADPFRALASRLLEHGGGGGLEPTIAELHATPTLLGLRLATIAAATGTRVLLAIDQLEELFTHGATDAARFVAMLAASSDSLDPVRIVVTLRDDFAGRFVDLRDVFVLRALDTAALRRAITAPLGHTGYTFEDETLVDEMLAELGASGSLPLLQFACRALWDVRDVERRVLSRAAYRELGGVAGALARHADRFVATLSPDERAVVRALLLRLVSGSTTRRVVEQGALLAELPASATRLLARLLEARLVVQRRAETRDAVLVELVHDALLRSWDQLARWVSGSEEQRQLLDELVEAARVWERQGGREDSAWQIDDVKAARLRSEKLGIALPREVERFLAAGETRAARMRRRARLRVTLVLAAAATITGGALLFAREWRQQRIEAELAHDNLGKVILELAPFEWRAGKVVDVGAHELPDLRWQLHAPVPGSQHRPGPVLEPVHARDEAITLVRTVTVEAPGGTAFLRIDGRGRGGGDCGPSWVRIGSFPGYSARGAVARVRVRVPTCDASRVGMVEIPAGEAIHGGPGEPATRDDYVEPEQRVFVPAFSIDRTEVSNAAFAPFAELSTVTGYPAPVYPAGDLHAHAGTPEMPVTSVDAYQAEAYCRFFGKRLPGDLEWTKAARGGLEVRGVPNPSPRRLFPWGGADDPRCANLLGTDDGHAWVAAVDSMPCGASPYGVVHLAGNVAEWIAFEGQLDRDVPLRVVRGGAVDSPRELEHGTTVFRNSRDAGYRDFAIGIRCVDGPPFAGSSATW